ncbi:MAG: peptidyl-tRNA hydrolase [Acidimicrobiales bacterium]
MTTEQGTPEVRSPGEAGTSNAPWAMQLAARVEKIDPPPAQRIAEAAILSVIEVLADDRGEPGGPWAAAIQAWQGNGRIRKLVRRARASAWDRAQEPAGATATVGGAEVRAYVPSPMDRVPEPVAKLQIQSTPLDEPERISSLAGLGIDLDAERSPPRGRDSVSGGDLDTALVDGSPAGWWSGAVMLVAVSPDVDMSWGKWCAQCAHGGQLLWRQARVEQPALVDDWNRAGRPVRVVHPDDRLWASILDRADVTVRDGGFTEIPAGTLTVAALWVPPRTPDRRSP